LSRPRRTVGRLAGPRGRLDRPLATACPPSTPSGPVRGFEGAAPLFLTAEDGHRGGQRPKRWPVGTGPRRRDRPAPADAAFPFRAERRGLRRTAPLV